MPVKDITEDAITVPPETSVRTVAETMCTEGAGVVVVDGTDSFGTLSERDVVTAVAADGGAGQPARAVMTPVRTPVGVDATAFDLLVRLADVETRYLPVVDDGGALVGVTGVDAVLAAAAELLTTAVGVDADRRESIDNGT